MQFNSIKKKDKINIMLFSIVDRYFSVLLQLEE